MVVDIQVALGRQQGLKDDWIRSDIIRAFSKSLEEDCYREAIDLAEGGQREIVSRIALFRLAFDDLGLDRNDQLMQESWFAAVSRAIDRALEAIAEERP